MAKDGKSNECGDCEGQMRFEKLLAGLSARLIHVSPDEVDSEIEGAQRSICELLGIDLAAVWQVLDDDPDFFTITHLYSVEEGLQSPMLLSQNDFPWFKKQMAANRIVSVSSLNELPPEASRDRKKCAELGVKSTLSIPLCVGSESPQGILGLNTTKEERDWPLELVERLKLVAQVFANAIARTKADRALRQSEAQLELAAGSADAGLWSLDLTTERYWMTDVSAKMIGFNDAAGITFPQVLDRIHPEDRENVQQTLARAVSSGFQERVTYRIKHDDGTERWMVSRGRVQRDVNGDNNLLMGVTLDITETKLKSELLRASEARLENAVEIAELGFYEIIDGKYFTFMDELGRDLIGIVEGEQYEHVSQFWAEHIHPDDRARVLELQKQQREGLVDKVLVEYRYLHPHRGTIWITHHNHIYARNAEGHSARTIGVIRDITAQKNSEENLRTALDNVQTLQDRLQMENVYLREQLRRDDGQDAIVGESEQILKMLAKAKRVAPTDSSVLITGETGTGKELLAQAIHDLGPRKKRPMVKVNCAALPAPLIEGELFGREKGAYTGAITQQYGRFEVADGSTIFLDEIGDLPMELQAKLLRVLQDGCFERLGSTKTLKVDVRIIAATNHDLSVMVQEGRFRADLFHRLNVFPITVPPLRERPSDIPLLVWKFIQEFNSKMGRSIESVPRQIMERIKSFPWPGNVRELRNMVERAMILSAGRSLKMELPDAGRSSHVLPATLEDVERRHICEVLERTRWRISGKGGAAEVLGLIPTTLHSRMKKLGISRPHS